MNVQTWRDLGAGKSPFDPHWRAHGSYIVGTQEYGVSKETSREKGSVREAFEGSSSGTEGDVQESAPTEWEKLAYSWQLDKKREEERDQEKEWRAIWRYIERRAGVESGITSL